MDTLSIILLLPLLYGAYTGFNKGLIHQVLYIIGLLIAIWGCFNLSSSVGHSLMAQNIISPQWVPFISLIITFIGIVISFKLLSSLLEKSVKFIGLDILNKLGGAVLGAVKVALIMGVFIHFFDRINNFTHIIQSPTLASNVVYQSLLSFTNSISPALH